MTTLRSTRPLLIAGAGVLALLPVVVLGWDALRILWRSESELLARFNGAAYEDVFGFGFWPMWALLAALELAGVVGIRRWARQRTSRYLTAALLAAFVGMSAASAWSYLQEHALWEKHINQN